MTEGENVSDLSSSLTLRISNENCGESDLTAEHMAEGISSSLDCGSAFKFVNFHEQGQMSFPVVLNSQGNLERPTSREKEIAIRNKSYRCGSEKDAGMGKWLELGLGSINTGSKCPPLVQHNHVSFTQDSSPNKEHTSRLNTRNQPSIPKLSPQIDCQFPYGLAQNCYGRGMASSLPSFSCGLDTNRFFCSPKTKISGEYPLHKHADRQFEERHGSIIKTSGDNFMDQSSQQSAVLQNVRDIIQSRRQWSSEGDFAWTRSSDFRPAISYSDVSFERKLPSNSLPATVQYQSSQCIQPLVTYKAHHKQTSAQFPGMQSFTANISQTENGKLCKPRKREGGVWFRLQVAPNKDGDCPLPQIPKTYLRIKDGTTTVLLVKKYLASKLGLRSESEIEITCRGQEVLPILTLQYVRDEIWCSSMKKDARGQQESNKSKMSAASFLSKYSNECLMILNYQRSSTGH